MVEIRLSDTFTRFPGSLAKLETWKSRLVDVLKDSPSKDRKFLRWNTPQVDYDVSYAGEIALAGELEVLPESSA